MERRESPGPNCRQVYLLCLPDVPGHNDGFHALARFGTATSKRWLIQHLKFAAIELLAAGLTFFSVPIFIAAGGENVYAMPIFFTALAILGICLIFFRQFMGLLNRLIAFTTIGLMIILTVFMLRGGLRDKTDLKELNKAWLWYTASSLFAAVLIFEILFIACKKSKHVKEGDEPPISTLRQYSRLPYEEQRKYIIKFEIGSVGTFKEYLLQKNS